MQNDSEQIERAPRRWTRFSRLLTQAVLAGLWLVLLLYDLFAQVWDRPPGDQGWFRLLAPIVALLPAIIRLLAIEQVENEQVVYKTFRNLALAVLATGSVLIVPTFVLTGYSDQLVPDGILTFFAGRLVCLIMLMALPWLVEPLVQIFRHRATGAGSRLPRIFVAAMYVVAVIAQLVPLQGGEGGLAMEEPLFAMGSLVALLGLILATRAGWIINLRREQKWKLVGYAMLATAGSSMLLAAIEHTGGTSAALLSFAPGLLNFSSTLGLALIFTSTVIFASAILALPTASAIDRRNTEVSSLANFARLLTQSLDTEHLVDTAISIACDAIGARTAWIELREGDAIQIRLGREPRITLRVARQLMTQSVGKDLVIAQAVSQRRRVEVVDRIRGIVLYKAETSGELKSMAAAPLQLGEDLLGTLYVAKDRVNGFDRRSVVLINALADQIALAIEQSRLIQSSFVRERFEQEMLIARDLQERLLPKQMPLSPFYELYAESLPASIVGGDYFDVVAFSDNTIGLLVADVSGKGASAALYMGMIKGIVQALSGQCASPKELLAKANVALHGSIDQRWFATMSCAQIIDEHRTLRVVRAGHCPTLVVRSGVGAYSQPRGLGLAIARPALFDSNLEIEEMAFCPGDYAIFFSDGLPEARSPEGEELGYDLLMEAVTAAAHQGVNPKEMREAIFERINAFTQGEPLADDSTLMILRWR
ncbi:MAG TPA: SpoIIE family protein phosphatase [Candidatus Kapabacteria bacterium]|nr:SpoIIE family protein phosphatase [Candidatus Kapabacteria bacterium]